MQSVCARNWEKFIFVLGLIRLPNSVGIEEEKVRYNIVQLHESIINILKDELKSPSGNIYKIQTNHNFLSHKIISYLIEQHVSYYTV